MTKVNYNIYQFQRKEVIFYFVTGCCGICGIAYIFYRSYVAFLMLLPFLYIFMKKKREELCSKRKSELSLQFRDAILSVSASLR